jgi:hypothetical protein
MKGAFAESTRALELLETKEEPVAFFVHVSEPQQRSENTTLETLRYRTTLLYIKLDTKFVRCRDCAAATVHGLSDPVTW